MTHSGYISGQVVTCDDSDDEDAFVPDTPTVNETNQEAEDRREQCKPEHTIRQLVSD